MTKEKAVAMVAAVGCCALFAPHPHIATQPAPNGLRIVVAPDGNDGNLI